MKYVCIFVLVGVAMGQNQNDNFRNNQFNNNQPQPNNQFNNNQPQPNNQFNNNQPQSNNQQQFNNQNPTQRPFNPQPRPQPQVRNQNNPFNNQNRYTNANRNDAQATILRQHFEEQPDGTTHWGFENSDGTQRDETLSFKNIPGPPPSKVLVQEGFFTYYDYEGRLLKTTYRADENGFKILEDNRRLL